MSLKILTIIGARPQFIKAAVVSRALKRSSVLQEVIVHTGQHYDNNMSEIFFSEMQIPMPSYNLAVQETLHGAMTAKMLVGIEEILPKEDPDVVLVYGDTNSTLAASLAAAKMHFPVAHVESGLRSFNMKMPEEINRIVTDKLSRVLFCPTEQALKNLASEGFNNNLHYIYNTGDVMMDAAMYYFEKSNDALIKRMHLEPGNYILSTIHRAENTNDPANLSTIIDALNELNKQMQVVIPLHPRTAKLLQQQKKETTFTIIEPVGYFDMLQLLANCKIVITDSGGLQKEAYFFRKFCVIMREQTEWVELLAGGYSNLAGSDTKKITSMAFDFIQKNFPLSSGLYGDGNAGEKIIRILESKAGHL